MTSLDKTTVSVILRGMLSINFFTVLMAASLYYRNPDSVTLLFMALVAFSTSLGFAGGAITLRQNLK